MNVVSSMVDNTTINNSGDIIAAGTAGAAMICAAGSAISEASQGLGSGISTGVQGIGSGISTGVQGIGSGISTGVQGIGSGVSTGAQGIGSGVGNVMSGMVMGNPISLSSSCFVLIAILAGGAYFMSKQKKETSVGGQTTEQTETSNEEGSENGN